MAIRNAILGEDVPITITYTDDTGTEADPDDLDADGTPDADITITNLTDGVDAISAAMTHLSTGQFEYIWDTAVDAPGTGTYRVSVETDFGGETKISRSAIKLE